MSEPSAVASIVFNEELLKKCAREYLEEFYSQHLQKDWYTREEIMYKTGIKSHDWIRANIDNHPYVKERGIKFNLSNSVRAEPRYTKEVDVFLAKFGLLKEKELSK